jgi:hypothetical protein
LAYLEALTGERPSGLSLQEASDRISAEVESPTGLLSHRQKMLVKFWSIEISGGQCTKQAFSEHLDNFYAADPNRKRAWELYKTEFGDSPKSIPVGIGTTYLEKIRSMDDTVQRAIIHRAQSANYATPSNEENSKSPWMIYFILILVLLIGLLFFFGAVSS